MGSAFVCVSFCCSRHVLSPVISENNLIGICPMDQERSLLIIAFKKKNSYTLSADWLLELISALDINASLFCACLLHSSILRLNSLSPHINVWSVWWINFSINPSYLFFLLKSISVHLVIFIAYLHGKQGWSIFNHALQPQPVCDCKYLNQLTWTFNIHVIKPICECSGF